MKRKIVRTKNEYVNFIKLQNNRTNLYTTVYDFGEFAEFAKIDSSVVLNRIFLDFDAHGDNLIHALTDLKIVLDYVYERNIEHTCFFSGRGFHLFLEGEQIDNIRPIQFFFRQIKEHLESNILHKSTLDERVGQSTRLRRIPNTVNMNSLKYCIPIFKEDIEKGLDEILILADKPRNTIYRTTGNVKIVWPEVPSIEAVEGEVVAVIEQGRLPLLPCLRSAIMVENPSHIARAYLVSWYRDVLTARTTLISNEKKNEVLEKIVEEIKHIAENNEEVWLDWSESETRKHARYTVFNNYKTPFCEKLISEGYCIGKCWRYPKEK